MRMRMHIWVINKQVVEARLVCYRAMLAQSAVTRQ